MHGWPIAFKRIDGIDGAREGQCGEIDGAEEGQVEKAFDIEE